MVTEMVSHETGLGAVQHTTPPTRPPEPTAAGEQGKLQAITDWIEHYRRAWEDADDQALGDLFTDDAVYRSHPFREPFRGREAIRAYWREATGSQADVYLQFGTPIVQALRAAVEWWMRMESGGAPLTLPGVLVLRFNEAGLCEELREYWHLQAGVRIEAHAGWGS